MEIFDSSTGSTSPPPRSIEILTEDTRIVQQQHRGEQLDRNPAAVYLGVLNDGSRRVQTRGLAVIVGLMSTVEVPKTRQAQEALVLSFPWTQLRYQHTAAIRSRLQEAYAAATVNRILCALRGVLEQAWKLELIDSETYWRTRNVESLPSHPLPAGRCPTHGEIAALMETCQSEPTPGGIRDAAIVAMLYGTGIRRFELAALQLEDYEPAQGRLRIQVAKMGHQRIGFLPAGAQEALESWLLLRGDEPGPLFCPIHRSGDIEFRQLSPQAIYLIVRKRARQSGVQSLSPHDLRRSCLTHLLDAGADLLSVQRIAGHRDPRTTGRYDRRTEAAQKRAAQLLHVPFVESQGPPVDGTSNQELRP